MLTGVSKKRYVAVCINILGGRQSSGCSRLKLIISAKECTFVTLKSRINSAKQSLNSESTSYQHADSEIQEVEY
jgi:hypothetical protein